MYKLNTYNKFKGEQYKLKLQKEVVAPRDTFERSRSSLAHTVFEANADFTPVSHIFENKVSGSATVNRHSSGSYCELRVQNIGDRAVRQSRCYLTYKVGTTRTTFVGCTLLVTSADYTKFTVRVGVFDDDTDKTVGVRGGNGYFFQVADGVASFVQRSSVSGSQVDTVVPQSNWNTDKLDGSGTSGAQLSLHLLTAVTVEDTCMDVGVVQVGFIIAGQYVVCHTFLPSGTQPAVESCRLPVRYEIISNNPAPNSPASTYATSSCSFVETGNYVPRGLKVSFTTPTPLRRSNGPVMTIRNKSSSNRSNLVVKRVVITSTTETSPLVWKLVINSTLTGAQFGAFSHPYSDVEVDTSATQYEGGYEVSGGLLSSGVHEVVSLFETLPGLGCSIAGVPDTATLVVKTTTPGNVDVLCSVEFLEDK